MGGVMKMGTKSASLVGGAVLVLALTAANRPSVFAQTSGGLWELDRGSGVSRQVRQCIADPALLAQIEHRSANCTRTLVRDGPTSAEIHYSCNNGGFGRTTVSMLTPRSYRVETQGISRGAPFHYVVQARRVGNCGAH
jgi:hypothetical protein